MNEGPMTRDFCARCAIKHLAQARALLLEARKGYPHHVWYAMGHMAEAEDEIMSLMPCEANTIRDQRVLIEQSLQQQQQPGSSLFIPDFHMLTFLVGEGAMLEEMEGVCETD